MMSMTGFGRSELATAARRITTEVRSYNSRYLEISVNLPPWLGALEPKVRRVLEGRLARGRVEVFLRSAELEEQVTVEVNAPLMQGYRGALEQLAAAMGQQVTLDHLLAVGGLFREERTPDIELVWAAGEPVLEQALGQLLAARRAEGEATAADLQLHLAVVSDAVVAIAALAPEATVAAAAALGERAAAVLDSARDDPRVVAALAVVLSKSDINEELVRARGHIAALQAAFEEGLGAKHMEFLCQEIQREINTIAAKSSAYEMSAAAVRAKGGLERMREQLRNVE
jgi:uncharacterized protein (TIGR00255 family)